MKATWANAVRTLVRVEVGGLVQTIPAEPGLPQWDALAKLVRAGKVAIADFHPAAALPSRAPDVLPGPAPISPKS